MRADLHTHSYFSDGEFAPEVVIQKAKQRGIACVALTDHNSVKGIPRASKKAKEENIKFIAGCEIMSEDAEILSYFVPYTSKKFKDFLERTAYFDNEMVKRKIKLLESQNKIVTWSFLKENYPQSYGNYNMGHILQLSNKNNMQDALVFLREIKSRIQEPKKKNVSTKEVIKKVVSFGAVPVLAHPWLYPHILEEENILPLIKAGLCGIELDNGDKNKFGRSRKVVKRIKSLAKEHNLILTKGSDFHGPVITKLSKRHKMGSSYCSKKVIVALEEKAKEIKVRR